jgi:N-acetylglutamate synthase
MSDHDLAWRMEAAFLHAWPALRREQIGDWLLQFASGVSRRANSANPRRAQVRDLDAGIAACAARYRAAGMPVLFRLPSIVEPAIEARLDGLGYRAEGETLTLHAAMEAVTARTDPDIALAVRPDANWLTAMIGAQGHTGEKDIAYRRIVEVIAIPAAFVALRDQGQLVSLAYGAMHDGLLMCESVVTLAAARGRGYARRTLASLMAWGLSRGAQIACLQVQADNHPAVALYRQLGLRAELYRYHYRRGPL